MSNTIFITANWTTGALSQQTISRQYDNNRYAVQFIGYPEGDGTEELDLYLLVWMSTAPGQKPGEITPIQLNSDQWYISNYFTQQVQVIKFQLCVLNEAGTYEAHSPIFSGRIGDSLEHDGTSQDIDVSTLFDAYREYVEELIIGAGAVIIDPVPTQGSSNAVSSGGVYETLQNIDARLNALGATWSNTAISLLEQIKSHVSFIDSEGSDLWDDLIAELDGAIPATYYAITWNGRNFSKSNNAISAREGKPYTCTVSPDSGYSISALSVIHNGNTVTPINNGDGTYTISIASVSGEIVASVTTALDSDVVDICLFAGQSNMDGRGTAEDATSVTTGLAYKWDNSNNRTVAFEAEGSLIPAYMQEYTLEESVPLVEVKEAVGGTGIAQYVSDYLPLATNMLTRCKTYLEGQGKTVRRVFMLWCQGETDVDGDLSTGTSAYESYFATLKSAVMQAGVNQIFIINIGQASNGTFDFAPIRTALQNVCNGTDVVMVSDKYYMATNYMKDRWHYTQVIYNVVGKNSADNTIAFFNGQTPNVKRFDSSDIYGVPTEYGTLNDWTYTLVNEKVRLDAYNGSGPDVRVYHQYLLDGYFYEARIKASPTSSVNACFTTNTLIESVSVDDGVRMMNPNVNADADANQTLSLMFKGCTNLRSFAVGTNFPTIVNCDQVFRGASKFESFNFDPKGSLSFAFNGTKVPSIGTLSGISDISNGFNNNPSLVSVGDIDGTYSLALTAFQNDSALTSVGTIKSTALTNINGMFNGCTSLAGVVRFESASISSATNAFNNCDLTQITIECPANSTTYTTISTAYPTANIVTF